MRTVYELIKASTEIQNDKIKIGCTDEATEYDFAIKFNTAEDALNELKKYRTTFYRGGIQNYKVVEEYFVQEKIYDDDDEWIDGGDIYKYSDIDIECVPFYINISHKFNFYYLDDLEDFVDDKNLSEEVWTKIIDKAESEWGNNAISYYYDEELEKDIFYFEDWAKKEFELN